MSTYIYSFSFLNIYIRFKWTFSVESKSESLKVKNRWTSGHARPNMLITQKHLRQYRGFHFGRRWTLMTRPRNTLINKHKGTVNMPKIIWMCPVCCKNLDRKAFLRPFKQRLIVERACFSCRTATLLRDNSGRAIQRALWRGDITELDARALQTKLNLLRKERATRRRNNVVSKLRKRQAEMKRYGAGLEKEQERRAKISAALTGRKRGSYMKVTTRI